MICNLGPQETGIQSIEFEGNKSQNNKIVVKRVKICNSSWCIRKGMRVGPSSQCLACFGPSTSFCKRLMARNMATKNSCMKHFKMTTSFRQHDSKINCPRTFCTRKAILLHIKIVKRHPSKSPAVTGKSKTSSECHQPFVHCHLDHLS